MADQLTTGNSSGTLAATDSPQAVPSQANALAGQKASGVQPGTASSLLNGSAGVTLEQPTSTAAAGFQTAAVVQPPHHRPNPVLIGGSALLFIVAIGSFWLTARSAKNTTK